MPLPWRATCLVCERYQTVWCGTLRLLMYFSRLYYKMSGGSVVNILLSLRSLFNSVWLSLRLFGLCRLAVSVLLFVPVKVTFAAVALPLAV